MLDDLSLDRILRDLDDMERRDNLAALEVLESSLECPESLECSEVLEARDLERDE